MASSFFLVNITFDFISLCAFIFVLKEVPIYANIFASNFNSDIIKKRFCAFYSQYILSEFKGIKFSQNFILLYASLE